MAPHSSTLAWKIPWTEEPGRLQSMGSLRVGHDWATSLSLFAFMHWGRKWQPTPVFLPGESQGEPGGLLSMGLHKVGHDWSDLAAAVDAGGPSCEEPTCQCRRCWRCRFCPWWGRRSPGGGNGNPLQYSCWRIPWIEEPGRLQYKGSQRIGHDWVTEYKVE